MDLFAPRHLLIILAVCLLVFGTKKLKTLGSDLGSAVRGFKQAMSEGESEEPLTKPSATAEAEQLPPPTAPASTAPASTASSSTSHKTAA